MSTITLSFLPGCPVQELRHYKSTNISHNHCLCQKSLYLCCSLGCFIRHIRISCSLFSGIEYSPFFLRNFSTNGLMFSLQMFKIPSLLSFSIVKHLTNASALNFRPQLGHGYNRKRCVGYSIQEITKTRISYWISHLLNHHPFCKIEINIFR
jgi:hypothetical protein